MSGQSLHLISIVRSLFNHILEVIKDVSSFHMEYSSILRNLLFVREYQYQMRNKVYSSLVLLFLNKTVMGIDTKPTSQSLSKEDLFRSTLMLHVLLENPPCDFSDNIRNVIVWGFCDTFAQLRLVFICYFTVVI